MGSTPPATCTLGAVPGSKWGGTSRLVDRHADRALGSRHARPLLSWDGPGSETGTHSPDSLTVMPFMHSVVGAAPAGAAATAGIADIVRKTAAMTGNNRRGLTLL